MQRVVRDGDELFVTTASCAKELSTTRNYSFKQTKVKENAYLWFGIVLLIFFHERTRVPRFDDFCCESSKLYCQQKNIFI